MVELLLYTTLSCQQSEALMLRIAKNQDLPPQVKVELVETVRESTPECYWDANDWRNGKTDPASAEKVNFPFYSGNDKWTHLQSSRSKSRKQHVFHDAQIMHTAYRGVAYECKQGGEESHGTYCYRGRFYTKWSPWKHLQSLDSRP